MKYLIPVVLGLALVGCDDAKKAQPVATESSAPVMPTDSSASLATLPAETATEVTVKYQDKNKKAYELKSSDNFETAILTDSEGKSYELKEAISGSGMKLEGKDGIYIHTKGEEGTLELIKGQPIDITEVK